MIDLKILFYFLKITSRKMFFSSIPEKNEINSFEQKVFVMNQMISSTKDANRDEN